MTAPAYDAKALNRALKAAKYAQAGTDQRDVCLRAGVAVEGQDYGLAFSFGIDATGGPHPSFSANRAQLERLTEAEGKKPVPLTLDYDAARCKLQVGRGAGKTAKVPAGTAPKEIAPHKAAHVAQVLDAGDLARALRFALACLEDGAGDNKQGMDRAYLSAGEYEGLDLLACDTAGMGLAHIPTGKKEEGVVPVALHRDVLHRVVKALNVLEPDEGQAEVAFPEEDECCLRLSFGVTRATFLARTAEDATPPPVALVTAVPRPYRLRAPTEDLQAALKRLGPVAKHNRREVVVLDVERVVDDGGPWVVYRLLLKMGRPDEDVAGTMDLYALGACPKGEAIVPHGLNSRAALNALRLLDPDAKGTIELAFPGPGGDVVRAAAFTVVGNDAYRYWLAEVGEPNEEGA